MKCLPVILLCASLVMVSAKEISRQNYGYDSPSPAAQNPAVELSENFSVNESNNEGSDSKPNLKALDETNDLDTANFIIGPIGGYSGVLHPYPFIRVHRPYYSYHRPYHHRPHYHHHHHGHHGHSHGHHGHSHGHSGHGHHG